MVGRDANEDTAALLQLDGAGLSPLVEIQFQKLLYKVGKNTLQEAWKPSVWLLPEMQSVRGL